MADPELKTPNASLIYTFDWSLNIPEGETLVEVTHTLPAPLSKDLEQTDTEGLRSTVQISGGVHGGRYWIEAEATLSDGETVPGGFLLRVMDGV